MKCASALGSISTYSGEGETMKGCSDDFFARIFCLHRFHLIALSLHCRKALKKQTPLEAPDGRSHIDYAQDCLRKCVEGVFSCSCITGATPTCPKKHKLVQSKQYQDCFERSSQMRRKRAAVRVTMFGLQRVVIPYVTNSYPHQLPADLPLSWNVVSSCLFSQAASEGAIWPPQQSVLKKAPGLLRHHYLSRKVCECQEAVGLA